MRGQILAASLALAIALGLGGTAPFGRLALSMGAPQLAMHLFHDPAWRGIAALRSGNLDLAASLFREADDPYNRGNAEVQRENYAAALEAYDIARSRGDADATANFDLVASYYTGLGIDAESLGLFPERNEGPSADSFVARGNARAAGTGTEVTNTNTMMGLAELDSRGRLGVRRVFDDKFMVADERWLRQLPDVPGDYMAARIAQEQKRRAKAGLSPPDPEDPR
ncbi:hypothetical protein [Roseovarius aestuariivivens]|uniref:hypothetical protein n=1 Tax=Roseovarius aestuariivivens TaxID=1888910 RepID=UPI001081ADD0|nr:hypothetical protein [Roseovarius aestuariivivens]